MTTSIYDEEILAQARDVIGRNLTWDNHGALTLKPDQLECLPQLMRYKDAGFDVVYLNIGFGEQSVEEHVRMLSHLRGWFARNTQDYVLVRDVEDIARAKATNRLAVGFNIEGANAIVDQLSLISLYYDLGVRWMLLAYNRNTLACGGCLDDNLGLTAYGRDVVAEMERVGMVVCCTHVSYQAAREIMAVAKNPVIFSHSNPRALHDHVRNIPDDLMRACAETGGVVGINGIGIFLGENDSRSETIVRHIDYAVQLIGPEHVGLGLDYLINMVELDEYFQKMKLSFPAGHGFGSGLRCVMPEQVVEIVAGLLGLGYSEEALAAILGGNWMRVAKQVWKPESNWT